MSMQECTYCSRHRLTASVAYVSLLTHTRLPITSGRALFAHWSVRQKLNRVGSVQFSSVETLCRRVVPRLHDEANIKQTSSKCIQNKRARRVL